jgi:peptidoglycan/LPS O-acetylase OafA/YrhL
MILPPQLTSVQRSYLDLVRFVAALLVVFGHAGQHFLQGGFIANGNPQGLGVLLFFLISGFLISTSALQKQGDPTYDFRDFFIDRFARIYSCYIPALILLPALDSLVLASPDYHWRAAFNWPTWLGNLVMLQDFPGFQVLRRLGVHDNRWFISSFGSARQFWTISIEWWIYMSFGATLFLVLRARRLRWYVAALIVVFAIEPLYYFVGGVDDCLTILWLLGMSASLVFLRVPTLAAAMPNVTPRRWLFIFLGVAGLGLISMGGRIYARNYHEVGELQFALFLALVVFGLLFAGGATRAKLPRLLERVIGFAAGYSYSLYLTHFTIMELVAIWDPHHTHDLLFFYGSVVLSNLFAIGFYFLFERHYKSVARFLKTVAHAERPVGATPA